MGACGEWAAFSPTACEGESDLRGIFYFGGVRFWSKWCSKARVISGRLVILIEAMRWLSEDRVVGKFDFKNFVEN